MGINLLWRLTNDCHSRYNTANINYARQCVGCQVSTKRTYTTGTNQCIINKIVWWYTCHPHPLPRWQWRLGSFFHRIPKHKFKNTVCQYIASVKYDSNIAGGARPSWGQPDSDSIRISVYDTDDTRPITTNTKIPMVCRTVQIEVTHTRVCHTVFQRQCTNFSYWIPSVFAIANKSTSEVS